MKINVFQCFSYLSVPLPFLLLPKFRMFDCLASLVPNWIAVFLNSLHTLHYLIVYCRPKDRATCRSNTLSPDPFGRVKSVNI